METKEISKKEIYYKRYLIIYKMLEKLEKEENPAMVVAVAELLKVIGID